MWYNLNKDKLNVILLLNYNYHYKFLIHILEKLIGKKLVKNIKINENAICQTILHFQFLTFHDRCVSLEINFGLFNAKKINRLRYRVVVESLANTVTDSWIKY